MLVIGIAGGTGSGKTTVVRKIIDSLPKDEVAVLPQDSYYRDNADIPLEERLKMNYDEPASIEWSLLCRHLRELKAGKIIDMPTYDFITCSRMKETVVVKPREVIVVEGILVLTDKELRDMLKPMHELYIEPSKRYADLIVPQGGNNNVAIKLLTDYIRSLLPTDAR